MIEKTSKILGQAKIIYSFILMMAVGMYKANTWANDQRYMQITSYETNQAKRDIRILNSKMADYETQLLHEKDVNKVAMIKALIINVKKDIKDIKGE